MPTLTITDGPHAGTELRFATTAVIGRGAAADLSVPDPSLSRRHARLTWQDDHCLIEDLGSANGTNVNGKRISTPTRLTAGDAIEVGFLRAVYAESHDDTILAPAIGIEPQTIHATEVIAAMPVNESGEYDRPPAEGDAAPPVPTHTRLAASVGRIGEMIFDQQALVSFVGEELLALMPRADRVFVMLGTEGQDRLAPAAVRNEAASTNAEPSRTLLEDVMANREARLVLDTSTDARYASADSMHAIGISTAIGVPIVFQNEVYGALQVDGAAAGVSLDRNDLAMALSLAAQLGMALGYARLHASAVQRELLEHDLALATKLQQHFLPERPPDVPGYAFGFDYRPALAVGGDFYDFLALDGGRLGIVMGDVSGKGVSAALYAAKLASDLRYQAVGQTSPSEILGRANRVAVERSHEGMFATCAVIVLSPEDGAMEMASAGHPLPLLRNGRGRVGPSGGMGNMPLGIDASAEFYSHRAVLAPADTLVLYTDGVSEALNDQEQMFGEPRLLKAVAASNGAPDAIVKRLRSELSRFTGSAPQSDDITIVCLRRDA